MILSNVTFSPEGWADYLYWQTEDKKTLERINRLITDAMRNYPILIWSFFFGLILISSILL